MSVVAPESDNAPPPTEQAIAPVLVGLDYTYSASVKLRVVDVVSLRQHPLVPADVFLLRNRPIRKASVCGIVVGKDEREKSIVYLGKVDDGTAVVQCLYWFSDSERSLFSRRTYSLGALLAVTGRVSEYRGTIQIVVNALTHLEDPNAEILWWLEVADLHLHHYSKPMVAPPNYEELLGQAKASAAAAATDVTEQSDPSPAEYYAAFLARANELHLMEDGGGPAAFVELLDLFIKAHATGVFVFSQVREDPNLDRIGTAICV
ncbi:CST complex subunit STN1, partial [Cladochytrium tenue]